MSGNYLGNAGTFLIDTLLGLYILTFMLRFLFQWSRADFYNPISQFLVKVTNPLLIPVRRIIPGLFGLDVAAITLMLALEFLKLSLISLINGATILPVGFLIYACAELLQLASYVFMFSIIIQAIVSWINPHSYNPVMSLLFSLNEPLLRPARRLLPNMGGLDLSPLIVLIALQLLQMLLIHPLRDLAVRIAM
ncbi:MAG: YggT family protein [Gammaproteobacteria bacterium]|nr:YggT family protein [Gammaproteobacteria bacterium]